MKKNVGLIDRTLRFFFGLFLLWLGLYILGGIDGSLLGMAVALLSVVPFSIVTIGICPIFHWFRIHSFSHREWERFGDPYPAEKTDVINKHASKV